MAPPAAEPKNATKHEAYAKLKRDLAAAFDDEISGYVNAKTAFVAATLAEALGPGVQVVLDRPLRPETSRS
jgi:hypothetical protein